MAAEIVQEDGEGKKGGKFESTFICIPIVTCIQPKGECGSYYVRIVKVILRNFTRKNLYRL
jgi:hypothetical protein